MVTDYLDPQQPHPFDPVTPTYTGSRCRLCYNPRDWHMHTDRDEAETPPTQHPKERGELVALFNSRPDWRNLRDYGLALYDAGLPVSLCFWMVYIEVNQHLEVRDKTVAQTYRFGILVNHLARISSVGPEVYSQLPEEWFGPAATAGRRV